MAKRTDMITVALDDVDTRATRPTTGTALTAEQTRAIRRAIERGHKMEMIALVASVIAGVSVVSWWLCRGAETASQVVDATTRI